MKYITYVGSYTADNHNEGLRIFESDAENGAFRQLSSVTDMESPTYMALTRDCTRLYTVMGRPEFGPKGKNGGLRAYAVKGDRLEMLNEVSIGPHTIPCHIALSPDEKSVVWAEYSHATCGKVKLGADGAFSGSTLIVQHTGDGPNKPRQDKAHAHCTIVTPDSKFQLVVDLGIDEIRAYDFTKPDAMIVAPKACIHTLPPGAGPRHVIFHPNGKFMFTVYELTNLVSCHRYTGEGFEHVQTQALLPVAFSDFSKAAAIKLSEDGSQVFCTNRGHDSITVFNVDAETGKMEFLANTRLNGKFPRDFEFMPGGKFCLVGLKESHVVASFAYDRKTGRFSEVQRMDGVYRPLFFKFKTK